jgi:hypothetical protein
MRRSLLLYVCALFFVSGTNATFAATPAPTITITASSSNICIPASGDLKITLTAHITNAPAGAYTIHWFRRGTDEGTTNLTGTPATDPTFDFTYQSSVTNYNPFQNWYAELREASTITSPAINIDLHYLPNITEVNPSGSTISLNTTDPPTILNNLVNNTTGSHLTFFGVGGAAPAVSQQGTSSNYQFDPSKVFASTWSVGYVADDNAYCQVRDTIRNTKIIVVDGQATLPTFLKNKDPMPICENSTQFNLWVYMQTTCFLSNPPPSVTIYLYYKNGATPSGGTLYMSFPGYYDIYTVTGVYDGRDTYSGNYKFLFTIDPSQHMSGVYYVYMSVAQPSIFTSCPYYSGSIPLFPKRNPVLVGLPAPAATTDIISLCASGNDTVFMRGNPSGGSYNYYLGTLSGNNFVKTSKINGSISPYNPPADDPSMQKFLAAEVFKNFAASDLNNAIQIVYTFPANNTGSCPDSVTRVLKFLPSVPITSTVPPPLSCFGNAITLSVNNGNPGDLYSWDFGDGVKIPSSPAISVSHLYAAPGKYNIRFKTEIPGLDPTQLCNNDQLDTVRVGATPVVDFDVYKNFVNTSAQFKTRAAITVPNISNTATDIDEIVSWKYDFGTNPASQFFSTTTGDTTFTYPAVTKNPYYVTHTVTAKWGCQSSITRGIPVFPVKVLSSGMTSIDAFNAADINGWYESGQYKNADTTSSWQNKTPAAPREHIITALPNGGDAWITGEHSDTSGYYNNEKSWVESPVFDIRQLNLPMVSLNTWTNTDNLFDGASLQYAFVDTIAFGKEKWHTLGKKNKGLEWYNSNTVISKPGNDLNGWTGDTSTQWKLSAYILDEPKDSLNAGRHLIRFRVALGTNSDNTPDAMFDGFAFDNFFIGERNRKVLLEEFLDFAHPEVGVVIDSTFKDPQATRIQYHVRALVPNDDINLQNRAEPSARALLYGIGAQLPRGVIDGILFDNSKALKDWAIDDFYQRLLIVSPFDIKLGYKIDGARMLNINYTISKTSPVVLPGPFVTQVAIVEKKVVNSQGTFTNVLRNMLPNSAGKRIADTYDWTNDYTNAASWSPFIKPESALLAIVFIQDENTKEIYQTNYIEIDTLHTDSLRVVPNRLSVNPNLSGSFSEVSLSPNPTSGDLNIRFNGILSTDHSWSISDALGNTLKSGTLQEGISAAVVYTDGLPGGLYYMKIEGEGQRIVKKFSLIK